MCSIYLDAYIHQYLKEYPTTGNLVSKVLCLRSCVLCLKSKKNVALPLASLKQKVLHLQQKMFQDETKVIKAFDYQSVY